MLHEPLVSIIMPAYNSENYITESINSVIQQTYLNWELIIIDDNSKDNTERIIKKFSNKDNRIRTIILPENKGVANARNIGIENARGTYISFLDSDDTWNKRKLSEQIKFMEDNNYHFTCTYYEKIDDEGNRLNRTIKMDVSTDYLGLLKKCPGNSTVIYNSSKLGKFKIPLIKKRNDYLMWLRIVKKEKLYCLPEVLSTHRVHKEGISSNKASLVKYHWTVYRKHEKLSIQKSVYLIIYWISKAFIREK